MTSFVDDVGLSLGVRIAAARRSAGLTQRQLADALGTSAWSVDRLESGSGDASRYLTAIADVTRRPLDWFAPETRAPIVRENHATRESVNARRDAFGRDLVLGAVVLLITIRFFTEIVPVLPRAANFIDVPIFVTLSMAALFLPTRDRDSRWYSEVGLASFALLLLATLSVAANSERVAVAPVLVFVYGFLSPLAVYVAGYRLWPPGSSLALSRTLVIMGIVQLLVVGLIQLPSFLSTHNPDYISGTFGTNAYQLVFLLVVFVALLIGIAALEPERKIAPFVPVITVATFAVMLLAQYRSLLVGVAVAMLAVGILLGGRIRGFAVVGFSAVALVVVFNYVAAQLPKLKLNSAVSSLANNPGTYVSGRIGVAKTVFRLYGDMPSAILVGTGPGTYSSRAWQTFAAAGSDSFSNVQGRYALALTGGKVYSTDVSTKYVVPQARFGRIVEGSHAASLPFSSYTSLLAELGVGGFLIIAAVYFRALIRAWHLARRLLMVPSRGDPLPAVALATAIAFLTLVQLAMLENWFEVTRATFVAWLMLAVVSRETEARRST